MVNRCIAWWSKLTSLRCVWLLIFSALKLQARWSDKSTVDHLLHANKFCSRLAPIGNMQHEGVSGSADVNGRRWRSWQAAYKVARLWAPLGRPIHALQQVGHLSGNCCRLRSQGHIVRGLVLIHGDIVECGNKLIEGWPWSLVIGELARSGAIGNWQWYCA